MSAFSEGVLVEKMNKLNSTQQSIQSESGHFIQVLSFKFAALSHWIIYHKKRFKQIVHVWGQEIQKGKYCSYVTVYPCQFTTAQKDRKLIYLYLANDIMQTSRKKGTEFISEFAAPVAHVTLQIFK
jgi:regulator of Ty1 transposition protein 103